MLSTGRVAGPPVPWRNFGWPESACLKAAVLRPGPALLRPLFGAPYRFSTTFPSAL